MGVAPDAIEYLWDRLHELEPTSELGGICAFKPGYHASREENEQNWPGNYSIQDSEDQGGDEDWCAAIDWTFPEAQSGNYIKINMYSNRLKASGEDDNDSRLNNLREFFGNTDKDVNTEGWDYRYAQSSTSSDKTHAWHIHISFDRKSANDRATMDRLLEVLRGEPMAQGMVGLRQGDKGEPVKELQALLGYAGFPPSTGVTGTYDSATSRAVVACRQSVGSSDDEGDEITGYAAAQIHKALAIAYAGRDGKDGVNGKDGVDGKDGLNAGTTVQITGSGVIA